MRTKENYRSRIDILFLNQIFIMFVPVYHIVGKGNGATSLVFAAFYNVVGIVGPVI